MNLGPLAKWPFGLLQVFELKNLGAAPNELGGAVQPTIESVDYYVREQVAVSRTITNGGLGLTTLQQIQVVPKGEMWLVYGVEANAFLPAGDAAEVTDLTIRLQVQGANALLVARQLDTGAPPFVSRFVYYWFPKPVILREADAIVSTINNLTAAATFAANFDLIVQVYKATIRI